MKSTKKTKKMAVFVDDDSGVGVEDVFSDDSSFHGGDELQNEYQQCATVYDPQTYWDVRSWDLQHIAARSRGKIAARGTKRKRDDNDVDGGRLMPLTSGDLNRQPLATAKRMRKLVKTGTREFNPYEGDLFAKQLNESVPAFLSRLPPSTTKLTTVGPWIWIANPFSSYRPSLPDVGTFKQKGTELLASYRAQKTALERQNPGKPPASITRTLKPDRDSLELNIKDLAKRTRVISGKWMLFRPASKVDETWAIVAKHTAAGTLGSAAKVETTNTELPRSPATAAAAVGKHLDRENPRLVCIYTDDFDDMAQVKHVLRQMRKFGLVNHVDGGASAKSSFSDTTATGGKVDNANVIYYKCDAYTHLDIRSGNEYKLKASMYNSADLFAEMSKDQNDGRDMRA